MKSTEVYRLLRPALAPYAKAHGMRRTTGGMLGWYRPVAGNFFTFWCQCSQDGWDAYAGSKFTVQLQHSDDPAPGTDGVYERLGSLLTAKQREDARTLQNDVIAALPQPDDDHPFLNHPVLAAHYRAKFDPVRTPYGPRDDIWFRYHSEHDVGIWGAFIAEHLPAAAIRFRSAVES